MKIGSVTVTYNRLEDLKKNISSILSQTIEVDVLLIVNNNSNDGTNQYLKNLQTSNDKIHVLNLDDNIGGAGGFSEGIKYLMNMNCDQLWLMDDDGRPAKNNCLEELLKYTETYKIIGPLIISDVDGESHSKYSCPEISKNTENLAQLSKHKILYPVHPFNGTLVHSSVVKKIGNVKSEMFIWGDEQDYRLRWIKAGFKEASISASLYYHPKNRLKFNTKFGLRHPEIAESRKYLFYRNQAYIDLTHRAFISRVSSIARYLICIILMESSKIKCIKGLVAGLSKDFTPPHFR